MSTRAIIAKVNANGTVRAIYLHNDGYLEHAGKILAEYYQDEASTDALLDLGDLSAIGSKLTPSEGSSHAFNTPEADVCVAYGRDRGEAADNCKAKIYRNVIEMSESWKKQVCDIYLYQKGRWTAHADGSKHKFIPIVEALAKYEKCKVSAQTDEG